MNARAAWLPLLAAVFGCASTPTDSGSSLDPWADVEDNLGSFDADWAESWSDDVEVIGEGASLVRDLRSGIYMALDWAQQSAVACFPGTQNDLFEGPHLLFALQQPAGRSITVRASPEAGLDLSVYTLQQGSTLAQTPPEVTTAVACEASLTGGEGEAEAIEIGPAANPYTVVVGVAGVAGVDSGRLLLEVDGSD